MEWGLGIVGSIVVAFVTPWLTTQREKSKLREEMKPEYSIEAALVHLLEHESFSKRSLKKIKRHMRGFGSDDGLRMALLRAGAIAFGGEEEDEMWGLLRRNMADIK